MRIEINENKDLVIIPETKFEELYMTKWYAENKDKPSKETMVFALMD